jgi:hypothetical protein
MISYGTIPTSRLLITGGALMLGGGGAPEALDNHSRTPRSGSIYR